MEQKPKIYLSKSKAGDLGYVARVRDVLHKLDVEVLEFAGGTYNTDALLKSDILLVVPPCVKELITVDENEAYWVGKGQYEEIDVFRKKYPLESIYIVKDISFDFGEGQQNLIIEDFYGAKVINKDWQTKYAIIESDDCAEFITSFGLEFKSETTFDLDFEESKSFTGLIFNSNGMPLKNPSQQTIQAGLKIHEQMMAQCEANPLPQAKRKIRLACITLC